MLMLIGAALAFAQRGVYRSRSSGTEIEPQRNAEFHFIRTEYTDLPQFHRGWGYSSRDGTGTGWWLVDWPDADQHFTTGVRRLTRLDVGDPRHFRLTDDRRFDYPWLYATQTAWGGWSELEVSRLR